jgi:hypothetical protein
MYADEQHFDFIHGCRGLATFGIIGIGVCKKLVEGFFKPIKGFPIDAVAGFGTIYRAGDESRFE